MPVNMSPSLVTTVASPGMEPRCHTGDDKEKVLESTAFAGQTQLDDSSKGENGASNWAAFLSGNCAATPNDSFTGGNSTDDTDSPLSYASKSPGTTGPTNGHSAADDEAIVRDVVDSLVAMADRSVPPGHDASGELLTEVKQETDSPTAGAPITSAAELEEPSLVVSLGEFIQLLDIKRTVPPLRVSTAPAAEGSAPKASVMPVVSPPETNCRPKRQRKPCEIFVAGNPPPLPWVTPDPVKPRPAKKRPAPLPTTPTSSEGETIRLTFDLSTVDFIVFPAPKQLTPPATLRKRPFTSATVTLPVKPAEKLNGPAKPPKRRLTSPKCDGAPVKRVRLAVDPPSIGKKPTVKVSPAVPPVRDSKGRFSGGSSPATEVTVKKVPPANRPRTTSTAVPPVDATWVCAFCRLGCYRDGLGELFGPYALQSNDKSEAWLHEDCLLWTQDVCVSGNRLVGLDEALEFASDKVCSSCRQFGATIGCVRSRCELQYHYGCAVRSDCRLRTDNYSMLCAKHGQQRPPTDQLHRDGASGATVKPV